jgi:predicted dinucleotide-binding enzyme
MRRYDWDCSRLHRETPDGVWVKYADIDPLLERVRVVLKAFAELDVKHLEGKPATTILWGTNNTVLMLGDFMEAKALLADLTKEGA